MTKKEKQIIKDEYWRLEKTIEEYQEALDTNEEGPIDRKSLFKAIHLTGELQLEVLKLARKLGVELY